MERRKSPGVHSSGTHLLRRKVSIIIDMNLLSQQYVLSQQRRVESRHATPRSTRLVWPLSSMSRLSGLFHRIKVKFRLDKAATKFI